MKLVLDLREKRGRDGTAYLFAAIPSWNVVVFVHPNGSRGGVPQHQLVIKPYTGAAGAVNDQGDGDCWQDSGDPSRGSEGPPRTGRP